MIFSRMNKQRKKRIIGLNFTPDRPFRRMFMKLQGAVFSQFAGVFFLDATKRAVKKIEYGNFSCSYKLNGWVIPIDKVMTFEQLFWQKKDLDDWDEYKKSVWAWDDTEGYHGCLFSFDGPVFGEIIIE